MNNSIVFICIILFFLAGHLTTAKPGDPSVTIISLTTTNSQPDSTSTLIDLHQKETVRLSYDQNYVVFRFINKEQPLQKSFSYRLVGLDYTWITCDSCSEARYAHLDGGDYTFLVKANTPNAIPATLTFVIEGNVWHKWWFVPMLFLYVFIVIGIIIYLFTLFQFRQKLIHQRLLHKEKIESMSELTAGIAHEILNPLNFVKNFSELIEELIDELVDEQANPVRNTEQETYLLNDLKENIQTIRRHERRASSIVKRMVEHAHIHSNERELININDLTAEFFQRAYKDLQTREPDFVIDLKTDFDPRAGMIRIAPQEISRVLLNVFDNAFYAVREKRNKLPTEYQPTVGVSTRRRARHVYIQIDDNGTGMTERVRTKMFMPFFTTKPAGVGTGLGLSLSYDIITNGHNGTLTVETTEGQGTKLTITLPA